MKTKMKHIEARIARIKKQLAEIGEMRPGSLTPQKRAGSKEGVYFQLSYTYEMKGHTEYVRAEHVPEVKRQIAAYKRFRGIVNTWVRLAIEHSQLKMQRSNRKASRQRQAGAS